MFLGKQGHMVTLVSGDLCQTVGSSGVQALLAVNRGAIWGQGKAEAARVDFFLGACLDKDVEKRGQ